MGIANAGERLNRTHLHHRTPVGGQRLAMIDWWVDHDNNGDFEVWESAFTLIVQ